MVKEDNTILRTISFKKRELDGIQAIDHDHDDHADHHRHGRPATKLQKFCKSYRTRRNLAGDCVVLVEELWWKGLEFVALKRSSVSFFDFDKSETIVSRWARARVRAAKVGKGLSKDEKAQELALTHWLEAIDPHHRYGSNLHKYYDVWFARESIQPFFYWLDIGDGKEVNLDKCPRTQLQHECIKYLGPKEREAYEVVMESGKLVYKQSRVCVETPKDSKWIFVLSTSRKLYVGEKTKGHFQHSSFLSGAATIASGRLVAHHGILEAIWPYSGHYRPTEENCIQFCSFLEDHHVDLTDVKKCPIDDDIPPIRSKIHDGKDRNSDLTSNNTTLKAIEKAVDDHQEEEEQVFVGVRSKNPVKVSWKWSTGGGPTPRIHISPRLVCIGPLPTPRPNTLPHLSNNV